MEEKRKKLWKLFIAFVITKDESKGCETPPENYRGKDEVNDFDKKNLPCIRKEKRNIGY